MLTRREHKDRASINHIIYRDLLRVVVVFFCVCAQNQLKLPSAATIIYIYYSTKSMDSCWSSAAEDLSHDCLISKGFVCICAANKKEELSSSDVDTSCVWCFDLGRYVTLSISQNTEGSLVLAIRDPKKRTCSRRLRQTEPLLQGKIDWAPHLMDGPILLLHRREKRSVVLRFVCLNSADSLLKSVTVTVPSTISVVPSTLHTSSDPRTRTTAITNG